LAGCLVLWGWLADCSDSAPVPVWSDSLIGWLPGWLAGWLWLTAWLLGWLAGVAGMAGRLVADFCMALH